MILLVIFIAGFYLVAVKGTERMAFDEARAETRSFLMTVSRMGEVSRTSMSAYLNSLPEGRGAFRVTIGCRKKEDEKGIRVFVDNSEITGETDLKGVFEFDIGDEIIVEIRNEEHTYRCRGSVDGLRRG